MRELTAVIESILDVLRSDFDRDGSSARGELILKLWTLQRLTFLTAPEAMSHRWLSGSDLLIALFPATKGLTGWRKAVADIWMDRPSALATLTAGKGAEA